MLGSLYVIRNSVNTKVYVGKTYKQINSRFAEHLREAKNGNKTRPLHRAIIKHGGDKFSIKCLGKYSEGDLEVAEIQAISEYDSYKSGYNATLGGDGTRYLQVSDEEIINIYKTCSNLNETGLILNIDPKTVKTVLLANSISITKTKVLSRRKPVKLLDINEEFDSAEDCAQFLIDSDISEANLVRTMIGIQRVCQGIRHTYKGLKFSYPCDPKG